MNTEEEISLLRGYEGRIKIMEVCGTHTESVRKNGIPSLLAGGIKLVSGPGCPVCVTAVRDLDALIHAAWEHEVLTFGDMFHVPGSCISLAGAQSKGGKVRLMYSPFEAIPLAKENPSRSYVIAAVGFETTAPVYAALMEDLLNENIRNVFLYTSLKTMPEALAYICEREDIDGFICPGHVSAVIGSGAYKPLCSKYKKPFVVAGFEGRQIIAALYEIIQQRDRGEYRVKNLYPSVVRDSGQGTALALINKYFTKANAEWRGIGEIAGSAYRLRDEYVYYSLNHAYAGQSLSQPGSCRCGDVLLGRIAPDECILFGRECRPSAPAGPCMVSSEGACSVRWRYEQP